MDARKAWLSYVPVPAFFLIPLLVARDDRLVRFHAWQGGVTVALVYALLMACGFGHLATGSATFGVVAALVLVWGSASILVGATGAARGRFTRIRGVWDVLALRQSRA